MFLVADGHHLDEIRLLKIVEHAVLTDPQLPSCQPIRPQRLASVGLEALGLGTNDVHTLGTMIYWAQKYSAVLRGQWWWFGPPIAMIATIFIGLFFVSAGIDRFANPRLRQQT